MNTALRIIIIPPPLEAMPSPHNKNINYYTTAPMCVYAVYDSQPAAASFVSSSGDPT